jgi:flagellar assembly factor FliW
VIDLALGGAHGDADVVFPDGLPGYPQARRFRVGSWHRADDPFALLVSTDEPDVAFAVVPAALLDHATVDVIEAAAGHPTVRHLSDAVVRCIVTPDAAAPTVNLLAPIVVDRSTGIARQVALDGPPDAARAPLNLRP